MTDQDQAAELAARKALGLVVSAARAYASVLGQRSQLARAKGDAVTAHQRALSRRAINQAADLIDRTEARRYPWPTRSSTTRTPS